MKLPPYSDAWLVFSIEELKFTSKYKSVSTSYAQDYENLQRDYEANDPGAIEVTSQFFAHQVIKVLRS